jgi:hypothetical protein
VYSSVFMSIFSAPCHASGDLTLQGMDQIYGLTDERSSPPTLAHILMIFLSASLILSIGVPSSLAHAEVLSDVEHLVSSKVQYREASLLVYPIIDLRPLFEVPSRSETSTTPIRPMTGSARSALTSPDSIQAALIAPLKKYANLRMISGQPLLSLVTNRREYSRLVTLARSLTLQGEQAFREVDLDRAHALIDSALDLFEQSGHIHIEPREVAQVYLTRGVIALEESQMLHASLSFRTALLYAPQLRLREALDGAKAYQLFEETRRQLIALSSAELTRFAERTMIRRPRSHALLMIVLPSSLHTVLSVNTSPTRPKRLLNDRSHIQDDFLENIRDQEPILDLDRSMNRLAARIWACLPFELKTPQRNSSPLFSMHTGWQGYIFSRSPISLFNLLGFNIGINWPLVNRLNGYFGGAWLTSNRDVKEDLRSNLSSFNTYIGAQWVSHRRGAHWLATLALEISYLSPVTLTREVGCKFFELNDELPSQLCAPQVDIQQFVSTWRVGPRVEIGGEIPLSKHLTLTLLGFISTDFYETSENSFGRPIGGMINLGYIFHSDT